jgi:3-oxoadipate enol-lactonase/4-carboxymuconolactone decarboxylase
VPELPRVGCPTLFVAGADDKMFPPAEAAVQAARIPGAQYQTLAASCHVGPLEQPHEVAALVLRHLAAI